MTQKVFVTQDFVLAMALTAAGFSLRSVENFVSVNGNAGVCCELDDEHNGVEASYLELAYKNKEVNLEDRVNEIIKARGITQDEYVLLAFDAARAGLNNRKRVITATRNNKPLIAKTIGDGRSLIYREGVPKVQIKKLLEEA
jgi:hypothetical protein